MSDAIRWLRGWYETLRIRLLERETYDFLVNYRHDPADFVDVERPDAARWSPGNESGDDR